MLVAADAHATIRGLRFPRAGATQPSPDVYTREGGLVNGFRMDDLLRHPTLVAFDAQPAASIGIGGIFDVPTCNAGFRSGDRPRRERPVSLFPECAGRLTRIDLVNVQAHRCRSSAACLQHRQCAAGGIRAIRGRGIRHQERVRRADRSRHPRRPRLSDVRQRRCAGISAFLGARQRAACRKSPPPAMTAGTGAPRISSVLLKFKG